MVEVGDVRIVGIDDAVAVGVDRASALERATVARGDGLIVRLAGRVGIASAQASFADSQDATGENATATGAELTETGTVAVEPPSPGSWVLAVEIRYEGGAGSGVYFWALEVR